MVKSGPPGVYMASVWGLGYPLNQSKQKKAACYHLARQGRGKWGNGRGVGVGMGAELVTVTVTVTAAARVCATMFVYHLLTVRSTACKAEAAVRRGGLLIVIDTRY